MHTHTCKCGVVFDCHAPVVKLHVVRREICILVLEEGDQRCDDCRTDEKPAEVRA